MTCSFRNSKFWTILISQIIVDQQHWYSRFDIIFHYFKESFINNEKFNSCCCETRRLFHNYSLSNEMFMWLIPDLNQRNNEPINLMHAVSVYEDREKQNLCSKRQTQRKPGGPSKISEQEMHKIFQVKKISTYSAKLSNFLVNAKWMEVGSFLICSRYFRSQERTRSSHPASQFSHWRLGKDRNYRWKVSDRKHRSLN